MINDTNRYVLTYIQEWLVTLRKVRTNLIYLSDVIIQYLKLRPLQIMNMDLEQERPKEMVEKSFPSQEFMKCFQILSIKVYIQLTEILIN